MMRSLADGWPRRIGRGPSARCGAQTVQAQISARSPSKPLLFRIPAAARVRARLIDSAYPAAYNHPGIRRVDPTHRRRGGRVAEGGGLLNRYTVNSRIVGSNPIPSASLPLSVLCGSLQVRKRYLLYRPNTSSWRNFGAEVV